MKLPVIVVVLQIFFTINSFGQQELYPSRYLKEQPSIDRRLVESLTDSIHHHANDSQKVQWYNTLSAFYHERKQDSALLFAERALALAQEIKSQKEICRSLASFGNYYGTFGTNELEKSLKYFLVQAEVAEKNGFADEQQRAFSCILNLYFYSGDFPSAMKLSTKALAMAEKNSDNKKIAYYNNLLGFIYLRQGNPAESRQFYQQYFDHASIVKDSTMMTEAKIGLAEVLLFENKPDDAIPLLLEARDYYEQKRKNIGFSFIKGEKMPYTAFTLAKAYHQQGNYNQALNECLRGFKYSQQFPFNLYDLANYYIITGNVYEDLGQMKKAIETIRSGLKLSITIKHAEDIRDGYESLSRIYARMKMYDSAFYYQKKFSMMKDSIINVRTKREIEQINAEYNIAKKDQEILQQQRLHDSEIAQQRILIIGVFAFFLLVFIIIALLYNRYRLQQKATFQMELNRRQNELFNTVTSIQDKERKRIAQDIHDQVGSVLSAAKLQLSGLEELKVQLTDDQKRKYGSAMSLMDRAAEELRNISHNLMPATLSRLGLVAALRGLFDQISGYSGLTIHFNSHGFEKRVEEPTEINIYPIVLELINNIVKHAKAKEATIQLIKYPNYINISVEDDGIGFDVDKAKASENGIGMRNLISRIQYLNGTLNFDSVKGRGTTVMIDIPT